MQKAKAPGGVKRPPLRIGFLKKTHHEPPSQWSDDVHVVDRNASATQPAKFLVVLIKDKGAPALVPAQ
jgi:hypothetical protein